MMTAHLTPAACPFCGETNIHTSNCYFELVEIGAPRSKIREAWERRVEAKGAADVTGMDIAAAERHADMYNGDERDGIKFDVLNAFYAGIRYARRAAPQNGPRLRGVMSESAPLVKAHRAAERMAVPAGYQLMPCALDDDMLRYAMECTKQLGPEAARRITSTYHFLLEAARTKVA